jgi:hypothetical protein
VLRLAPNACSASAALTQLQDITALLLAAVHAASASSNTRTNHQADHAMTQGVPLCAAVHLRPFLSSACAGGVTALLSFSTLRCSSGNRCAQMQSCSMDSSLVGRGVLLGPVVKDSAENLHRWEREYKQTAVETAAVSAVHTQRQHSCGQTEQCQLQLVLQGRQVCLKQPSSCRLGKCASCKATCTPDMSHVHQGHHEVSQVKASCVAWGLPLPARHSRVVHKFTGKK